jgi:hypothetical protein
LQPGAVCHNYNRILGHGRTQGCQASRRRSEDQGPFEFKLYRFLSFDWDLFLSSSFLKNEEKAVFLVFLRKSEKLDEEMTGTGGVNVKTS